MLKSVNLKAQPWEHTSELRKRLIKAVEDGKLEITS